MDNRSLDIRQLTAHPEVLDVLYRDVLSDAFPPAEILPLDRLRDLVASPAAQGWIAQVGDRVQGCAIGEWSEEHRVVLLDWLAVHRQARGEGIGGRVLEVALGHWREAYRPCLILAEVEDPAHHGSWNGVDPQARLRFYQRRGARALDLPYFQPSLSEGLPRVSGLHLMVLHADPPFLGLDPETIDAGPLRSYLEFYLSECEGVLAHDEQVNALWRALDRPRGVPLLRVPGEPSPR